MEPSCANLIILVFFLCTTRFENQLLMFLITLGELLDGNTQLQAVCMDILLIWFTYIEGCCLLQTLSESELLKMWHWRWRDVFVQVIKVLSQKQLYYRKMYLLHSLIFRLNIAFWSKGPSFVILFLCCTTIRTASFSLFEQWQITQQFDNSDSGNTMFQLNANKSLNFWISKRKVETWTWNCCKLRKRKNTGSNKNCNKHEC